MKYFKLLSVVVLISTLYYAQEVKTFAEIPIGFGDGMTLSSDGDLYVSSGYKGDKIIKINREGSVSTFVSGLNGPVGIDFDSNGNLFVANYNDGTISKIAPDGSVEYFASGLSGPSGLVINDRDEIFVALYGANFSGNGKTIIKFLPDGSQDIYAFDNGILDAIGIYTLGNDELITTNWQGGVIRKILADGSIEEITTILGANINQIAVLGEFIYVPSPNKKYIYRVKLSDKSIETFAGTGITGDVDGDIKLAQFKNPNSIAVSPEEKIIYILDPNSGKVKMIDLSVISAIEKDNLNLPKSFNLDQNFPNPFNPSTQISFSVPIAGIVNLTVYDSVGREVAVLLNDYSQAGNHLINFNALELSSGIYFYKLSFNGLSITNKMLILK